jgi:ElaB/YqjD/DUF883 family membrane-anchored ribosome-binding protein
MDQNDQQIQLEMQLTRASLAEKLETLEQKVVGAVGTVEKVTDAVTDTVEAIRDSVEETTATMSVVNETVKESVKSVQRSFDVNVYIEEHPWWVVGGSVATGFCLGTLFNRRTEYVPRPSNGMNGPSTNGAGYEPRIHNGTLPSSVSTAPSPWAAEIDKLKGLALGALFGTVRELVASSLPEPVGREVKVIIDSVTKKAGGEPIASSAWASLMQPRKTRDPATTSPVDR